MFGAITLFGPSCGEKSTADHHTAARAGFPCVECHRPDYDTAASPDHVASGLPTTCQQCHSLQAWRPAAFGDHATWPLTGAHVDATCSACHVGGVYAGTARECVGCHSADFAATTKPAHQTAGFPSTCELCHSTAAWVPSTFDHSAAWPLTGAHTAAACASCHSTGYAGTARECQGCHLADWEQAADPDHVTLALPKTCEACHATAAWAPADYAGHDAIWPLLGKHAAATCESCHAAGYAGTPTDCVGCHQSDYDGTKDPVHAEVGYPTACAVCHSAAGWKPAVFDHDAKWPLTGAHADAACESCHADGKYAGTPDTCVGCHQADYDGTKDPDHATLGLPTTCNVCHGTAAWKPADFDGHSELWPLLGKHADATCESCHAAGYTNTPTTCDGCHQQDYADSQSPPHASEGYPTACETCHAPAGWKPSSFNHATTWPLTGAHVAAQCASCHSGGLFAGTTHECSGCHLADFLKTTDPDHETVGFPQTCDVCHSTAAWKPSQFEGHETIWPLLGKHAVATCESCHAAGYTNTPTTCDGCHHTDYLNAAKPDHDAPGYPTSCESCHAPAGWTPTSFNHASWWSLTGAHTSTSCAQCHVGGQGAGIPTTCNGCHAPDYAASTNPSHTKWALSTACETCHSTTAWPPATFTKSTHGKFFTLTSGSNHKDFSCTDCHKTPQWSDWICVSCHTGEHNLSSMNNKHSGDVPKYNSTMAAAATPDLGCKSCHPTGEKK
ncbi:MAG: hypothetical protein R3F39_19480 [Myxococcota bacterium]